MVQLAHFAATLFSREAGARQPAANQIFLFWRLQGKHKFPDTAKWVHGLSVKPTRSYASTRHAASSANNKSSDTTTANLSRTCRMSSRC
jgi:hypothetical protein